MVALLSCFPRTGCVLWLGVRPVRRGAIDVRDKVEAVANVGLVGDHYQSRSAGKRQVTLIQAEHLAVIAALMGEAPIDPALAGLLLLQPGKDLSDAALDAIDTFVVGGGALAVFAGAVELPAHAPEMTAGLDRHRLDELLKGYGIELRSDLVVGPKGGVEVLMPTREGSKLVRAPGILSLSPERQQGSFDARFTLSGAPRELWREIIAVPMGPALVQAFDDHAVWIWVHEGELRTTAAHLTLIAQTTPALVAQARARLSAAATLAARIEGVLQRHADAAQRAGTLPALADRLQREVDATRRAAKRMGMAALVLLLTGLLAALVPAVRAARTDPVGALRAE